MIHNLQQSAETQAYKQIIDAETVQLRKYKARWLVLITLLNAVVVPWVDWVAPPRSIQGARLIVL